LRKRRNRWFATRTKNPNLKNLDTTKNQGYVGEELKEEEKRLRRNYILR